MGDINLEKNELPSRMLGRDYLKQVDKISNYFIRSFSCADEYVVVLTQTGEVIHIDEKLNINKLYCDVSRNYTKNEEKLEFLAITKENIVAMSRKEVYVWIPEYSRPPIHPAKCNSSTRYENTRESKSTDKSIFDKYKESEIKFSINSGLTPRMATIINKASGYSTPQSKFSTVSKARTFKMKAFKLLDHSKMYECKLTE